MLKDGHEGETDPHGTDSSVSGAKMDGGKVRASLVLGAFARALWKVCEVGTNGANKYSDNGWLDVPDGYRRYDDAQIRHWLKSHMGEQLDPEWDIEHQAHEAWNALAKLEHLLREKEDGQKVDPAADHDDRLDSERWDNCYWGFDDEKISANPTRWQELFRELYTSTFSPEASEVKAEPTEKIRGTNDHRPNFVVYDDIEDEEEREMLFDEIYLKLLDGQSVIIGIDLADEE